MNSELQQQLLQSVLDKFNVYAQRPTDPSASVIPGVVPFGAFADDNPGVHAACAVDYVAPSHNEMILPCVLSHMPDFVLSRKAAPRPSQSLATIAYDHSLTHQSPGHKLFTTISSTSESIYSYTLQSITSKVIGGYAG